MKELLAIQITRRDRGDVLRTSTLPETQYNYACFLLVEGRRGDAMCYSRRGGGPGDEQLADDAEREQRQQEPEHRGARLRAGFSVTGRRPLRSPLLLGSYPAPSRQISRRHQDASAAKPTRRSGSPGLRVEHFTIPVDPGGICTVILRGDMPRRRVDLNPPRDESEGL